MQSIKGEPALTFYKANHIPPPLFFSLETPFPFWKRKDSQNYFTLHGTEKQVPHFVLYYFLWGSLEIVVGNIEDENHK